MKIDVEYFDNEILFCDDKVFAIEIENKKYFYRFVNNLYDISNNNPIEEIKIFNDDLKEINCLGKIQIFTNYFEIDFESRKYSSGILKYINDKIQDEEKETITKSQQNLIKVYSKILNNLDLPLTINSEINVETLTKSLKISVNKQTELLDNILLLIDLERELKINEFLIFINLKQYLSKEELQELYKYAVYNQVRILLIDSGNYGTTLKNEKKLIIDTNLDEIMI